MGKSVNWLDVGIVVAMLVCAYLGLTLGLVRQGVALLAALLGVLLAGRFYNRLASDISIVSSDTTSDQLIAFTTIFLAMVLAGYIAAGFLREVARSMLLDDNLDGIGGLLCGLLLGFVLVEMLLIGFTAFPAAGWARSAIDGSLFAPLFLKGAPLLLHLLPSVIRQAVQAA
jgi:membrane protein required for colicin V production